MPIAAVPEYLAKLDLSSASPGLRFGMYLPLWGKNNRTGELLWTTQDVNHRVTGRDRQEREFRDDNKRAALQQALPLNRHDVDSMAALAARQAACMAAISSAGQRLVLDAKAIAPLSTGLGNEHPLENGFAFLWPYGLPYLPGSGVKGVLRQAARELAGMVEQAKWDIPSEWSAAAIEALFGKEDSNDARRGALSFWDVIPQVAGKGLQVEVMTAHQSHYYQGGETPHESGQPIPINFVTVPPGSGFTFHVVCDLPFLACIAPGLAEGGRWKALLEQAFAHAFDWLGFGAKTAVGYGAMGRDEAAEERRRAEQEQARVEAAAVAQREQALAAMSPMEREVAEFLDARPDKNQRETSALLAALKQDRWNGEARVAVAEILKHRLQAEDRWKTASTAKNPNKDKDYQNTLLVQGWLQDS